MKNYSVLDLTFVIVCLAILVAWIVISTFSILCRQYIDLYAFGRMCICIASMACIYAPLVYVCKKEKKEE